MFVGGWEASKCAHNADGHAHRHAHNHLAHFKYIISVSLCTPLDSSQILHTHLIPVELYSTHLPRNMFIVWITRG